MGDYGYTIDDIIVALSNYKKWSGGNTEVVLPQIGNESENGDMSRWDAHISSVELDTNKEGKPVVRIY